MAIALSECWQRNRKCLQVRDRKIMVFLLSVIGNLIKKRSNWMRFFMLVLGKNNVLTLLLECLLARFGFFLGMIVGSDSPAFSAIVLLRRSRGVTELSKLCFSGRERLKKRSQLILHLPGWCEQLKLIP